MNHKKNLIYILIIFFSTISLSKSNESIAYLDLDNIVKNTKAGKSIINKLKISKESALKKFEQKEKALKKVEEDINKQKNGLGLDWLTPIGPLTFSLAHPITQAESDVTEVFRFNLGTSF
jgi:hypothetical protein